MRKTLGPIVVVDTNAPHRPWSGNQATLLCAPIFAALVLALVAYLSAPLIPGLAVADVAAANGTLALGVWGWCATANAATGANGANGADGANGTRACSAHRAFGGSYAASLDALPEGLAALADVSRELDTPYVVANAAMHLLACIALWLTLAWTLAAAGEWKGRRRETAPKWTRWAFAGTFCSAALVLVAWALDLGFLTRVQAAAVDADGSQPKVTPGAAIWMNLVSWLLAAASFTVRAAWSKFMPAPSWMRE